MVVSHAGQASAHVRTSEGDARSERPSPHDEPHAGPSIDWAGALDEGRRQLVAAAGHELKTPLSIVLGLCRRLLAAGALEEGSAGDVQRIRANAYVLLQRVDELLLAARLGSGRMELQRREVDVARLVREIVAGFHSVAEARGQTLTLAVPATVVAAVDEEKLLSVVSNLVANALKFAPAGGQVRCTVTEGRRRLRIEVADSGAGVPRGLRREVFERYRQGAGSAARPHGSGLGLAIVRELVALHGGTVTLSDAPEGGALFVVELPRTGRAHWRGGSGHAPPRHVVDVAERQRSVVERLRAELAAEDRRRHAATAGSATPVGPDAATATIVTADAELGTFVGELLAGRWRVVHAVDAMQAARRAALGPRDVVLLDAAAGAGAARTLLERLGSTPVLAIACDAEDVATLMHAGAEDCVIKPFASEELLARLDALSARRRATARREAALAGLDRAFDLSPTPMALIAPDGELLRVNGALCRLLGHAEQELVGRSVRGLCHPDDLADDPDRPALVLHGRATVDRRERRLARADGTYVRVRISASLVGDDRVRPCCLLWHLADAEAGGESGASGAVELVGGAPGRRAFERALRHQIMRCERYAEQAALVRCSLDDLVDIRRRHGAEAADHLVQGIIDAVRRRLRDTDVVAFVGGHELAAVLAHADLEAARIAAAGMREAVQGARVATAAGPVGTAASVGVSPLAHAGTPGRALLEAGLALEAARGR